LTAHDFADELDHLTDQLTAEGWDEADLGLAGSEIPEHLTGIALRLLISPGRRALLTANWRATHTGTELQGLDPHDPEVSLWRAQADNLPVRVLMEAARAAAQQESHGPLRLLRDAGWTKQPPVTTGPGTHATIFTDPTAPRSAAATYLSALGHFERGPWLITRDDLTPTGGPRPFAHTTPSTPGAVITALALTP
jgi:hypothetical protein